MYLNLINRCHHKRCVAVVLRLDYLIMAVDPWGLFAQHLVRRAVDPSLGLSALMPTTLLLIASEVYLVEIKAAVVSILLYGYTTWTLIKRMEKKLDGNYTRMLRAVLNKSWRQHPTKQQLYGHLPSITKAIQIRRTRHAGHYWRSKDELISDVILWTSSHGRTKVGRPAGTYLQQLCTDTRCSLEDRPGAMDDRYEWQVRGQARHDDDNSLKEFHNLFLNIGLFHIFLCITWKTIIKS